MVVAVVRVRVMEMAVYEVVDVVAMRNWLMSAVGAVDVSGLVALARMVGSAVRGVLDVDVEHMLVDVVAVRVMEMALVQVVDMIAVRDRGVSAAGPVLVGMIGVRAVLVHAGSLP